MLPAYLQGLQSFARSLLSQSLRSALISHSIMISNPPSANSSRISCCLQAKYVQTYAVLVVILLAVRLLEGFAMTVASRHASQRLHDINFSRVMTGTMAYFDTTPLGRILNRFSGM